MLSPVFHNDGWVDAAAIPLDDPAVVQGVTLVETFRLYDGRVFEPLRHEPRLRAGPDYLQLDWFPRGLDPFALVQDLADRLPRDLGDAAAVLLITPGREQPTVICHARPLPSYDAWLTRGVPLVIPNVRQDRSLPRTFKHRSRLHWWKADQQAKATNPDALAWLLDHDDVLTETSVGNIVAVRGDRLLHAPADRVVPGITAGIIAELADDLGLTSETEPLTRESLRAVDELWMTSTGCGVAPIASVDGIALERRTMYDRIRDSWDAYTSRSRSSRSPGT